MDTILLDKTGTITLGNRMATEFCRRRGCAVEELADAAQLASLADETPEGRSIVVLAKERHGLRGRELTRRGARFVPFSAQTRMSGCDLDGRVVRKGAVDAVARYVAALGGRVPAGGRAGGGRDRARRRDAAGRVRRHGRARRRAPEGRGQGRHARALRAASAPWASAP